LHRSRSSVWAVHILRRHDNRGVDFNIVRTTSCVHLLLLLSSLSLDLVWLGLLFLLLDGGLLLLFFLATATLVAQAAQNKDQSEKGDSTSDVVDLELLEVRFEIIEADHKFIVLDHDDSLVLTRFLDLFDGFLALLVDSEAIAIYNDGTVLAKILVHAVGDTDIAGLSEQILAVAHSHREFRYDHLRLGYANDCALPASGIVAPLSKFLRACDRVNLILDRVSGLRIIAAILSNHGEAIVPHKRISGLRLLDLSIELVSTISNRVSPHHVDVLKDGKLLLTGNRSGSSRRKEESKEVFH